ncbi:acetyl-CoA carboxylase biotin carboxyl carrier protein [Arcicella aurantiaca]|uniref:Biotin carboxyl carrier protein of acetyl-CoA carboxylase n=1 Tax=Arcicella aurantiaca TaxID=591202 RepID=A0A316E6V3_9BACT|nr:acetyl-CoA carboxylase biotin carboxyl carrier protein [Arcicella aurantiaca]PWK26141.1 acetyl-CoA carboxylase biotin carboxyl carrier protein [Arcicella aurantiaca]
MENKEIQKLLDFIAQSTLDEVNIETSELKLSVKRYGVAPVVQQVAVAAPVVAAAPVAVAAAPASPVAAPVAAPVASNRVTIKSPMIGTFYRSAGPDKASFVEIGTEISKGKTVCIIEAMKLFNEIEAEISGKIVEVLVENATPVEFDQPLFVVEQ